MKKFKILILIALLASGCYDSDGPADDDVNEFRYASGVGQTILFLGDSRVQMGNWENYLPNTVINYGRYGSSTKGILNRIPLLNRFNYDWIVLQIGGNDINMGRTWSLIENWGEILRALAVLGKPVIVLEVAPTRIEGVNPYIVSLNAQIKPYCEMIGFIYVPLPELVDENGMLKEEYTVDGVHFSEAAYELISQKIDAIVNAE